MFKKRPTNIYVGCHALCHAPCDPLRLISLCQIACSKARLYYIRLAFEHAIWRSEMKLNGASGDKDMKCLVPTCKWVGGF